MLSHLHLKAEQRPSYIDLKIDDGALVKQDIKISEESETDDEEKDRETIRCRFCAHTVTRPSHRIEINGRHHHTFNNPSGHLFDIGCFSMAEGCVAKGQPTLEFTWFTGCSWRFALCANCHAHLGWLYQSMSERSFYGLILNHLSEK